MIKILTVLTVFTFVLAGSSMFVFAQTSAEVDMRAEATLSEEDRANDLDSDDDGVEDAEESDAEALDDDSDDDGIPTALPVKELDKATPKLMELRANGDDQTTPLLYQGLRVRGELCEQNDDCNDDDDDVSPEETEKVRGELWVHVRGDEVRGMSAEAKAQVQERLREAGEANTANDFGLRVASAALENEAVTEIVTNDTETEVHYRTRLNLFGFIPVTTTAVARVGAEGEVSVQYPWYRFLSRVEEESTMSALALELRSSHDALIEAE